MLRLPLALMQAEYHEVRTGGAPDRDCLCDFRTDEAFFIGTTNVDGLWSARALFGHTPDESGGGRALRIYSLPK